MGSYVLVFDTETTIDTRQQLTFGMFRYCYVNAGAVSTLAEGILYADDLPSTDPDGFAVLQRYAATRPADVDMSFQDREPNPRMEMLSRDAFANRWLWQVAYRHQETVVGFNLPFDFTRIAIDAGEARKDYHGGFSLALWRTRDGRINEYRPRLRIKMLDSKKAFISFSGIDGHKPFAGNFCDLRTLAFALSNRSHSLASACEAFGVEHGKMHTGQHGVITDDYADYCRRDVLASVELYAALSQELARHELDTDATRLYSPASVAKAYFRKMRIPQPLKRGNIAPDILGYAMSSFYGARAECRIRRQEMPVAVYDFTSMYPTVNTLMGMWELLTAARIEATPARQQVQDMLNTITLESCFEPDTWRDFVGIAKIRPNADVVPVRAQYSGGGAPNIGVNYLTDDDATWYAIPDLVASTLLTGHAPEILDAIRFTPHGTAAGLRSTLLHGTVEIDPARDDFFPFIVEMRAQYKGTATGDFLKVLANSGCYGIFAELNKRDRDTGEALSFSDQPLGQRKNPEMPGPYTFPPIATCITAAARLMLAMLEKAITDAGGAWVFTDTDSMAIVAAETAGKQHGIRVLSYDQAEEIAGRFDRLNPYASIPDLLKLEYRGWCYSISAKRYALYHVENERVVIDKNSEHGLGHLLNPTDPEAADTRWIAQLWQYLISTETAREATEPAWLDRPAISRYSVSQPSLLRSFDTLNDGKPYSERIKPANFILVGHAHPIQPTYTGKVMPIAPYDPVPARWTHIEWQNKHHPGHGFRIDTLGESEEDMLSIEAGIVYVQSYRDVLRLYAVHPEEKFAQPDGRPCTKGYRGRLVRMHVRAVGTGYVGKESNEIELVQQGLISASSATRSRTIGRWERLHRLLLPVIGHLSIDELAAELGIPRTTAGYVLAGRNPSPDTESALVAFACSLAASDLGIGYDDKADPLIVLTKWKDTMRSQGPLTITTVEAGSLKSES
ncbi:hypothetical protein HUO13_26095 [Saccharopolyspora erythraea]|uniref:hypothetical protein n=1 Tax=Saccharopolyspora erythraea TaxID=1836 RepID=UPI001BABC5A6|nr:hypothetical protein [Saccharopolyspora erythraea]QUH03823.1 hypothetical protein HUO13_26095 [Saccharopolyspora erythraea]